MQKRFGAVVYSPAGFGPHICLAVCLVDGSLECQDGITPDEELEGARRSSRRQVFGTNFRF
jgi:hypothetical protein